MAEQLPNIFLFNPTCEYAVANSNKFWQPNKLLQKMEEDLNILPSYLAEPDDIVLVRKKVPDDFINSLQRIDFKLPYFKTLKDALDDETFIRAKKNKLMPWGWSPAVHQILSPLKPSCSAEFKNSPVASWKPEHKQICSREFALEILKSILNKQNHNFLLAKELLPRVCKTKNDFESAIKTWGKIMVKAPWSSSGRGLQPVTKTPVHPKVWEKLLGIVKEQGFAVAEPFLNKVFDMAFQFKIDRGTAEFVGTSFFGTDQKGQYQKNYLNGLPENTEKTLAEFVEEVTNIAVPALRKEVEQSLIGRFYEGYLGIDTLIYLNEEQQLKVNPCLEINMRQNMGLLSLTFAQFLQNGKKGIFSLFFQPGISFKQFAGKMNTKHPLKTKNGKIESGFLPLTPLTDEAAFGAYLLV